MKRSEIIERIITEHQKVVESLRQSVRQYKTASDLDEESTHDPEDFSHQTEAKDMQLYFEKALGEQERNSSFLQSEKEKSHDVAENGSLIGTDDHYIFVGISVPIFKIGKKEVISLSADAPAFSEIKGKTVGDKIKLGDNSFKINKFL